MVIIYAVVAVVTISLLDLYDRIRKLQAKIEMMNDEATQYWRSRRERS